jgi:uncharacterized protein YegL
MYDEFSAGTTRYQLNLLYLLDTSGSMIDEPINQLNLAMEDAIKVAEEAALEKEVQLLIRVIEFNNDAKWIFGDTKYGVEHIDWVPLSASGGTNTASAIKLAQSVMHREFLGERNFKPIVILISDGLSNDPQSTLEAISELKSSLKSSTNVSKDKIIRIAIGVQDANKEELISFASVGTIISENSVETDIPFVFNIDKIDLLKDILKQATVSSINSCLNAGVDETDQEVKLDLRKEDTDWAE